MVSKWYYQVMQVFVASIRGAGIEKAWIREEMGKNHLILRAGPKSKPPVLEMTGGSVGSQRIVFVDGMRAYDVRVPGSYNACCRRRRDQSSPVMFWDTPKCVGIGQSG